MTKGSADTSVSKPDKKDTGLKSGDREETSLQGYLKKGIIGLPDGTEYKLKKLTPKKDKIKYTDLRTIFPSTHRFQKPTDLQKKKKPGRPKKKKRGRPKK
jgi:hypothetical protein